MRHELVHLFERAGIEEQVDALARGQLPRGVLPLDPRVAAASLGAPLEICESVFGVNRGLEVRGWR
jgi:hypothetical protein